MFRFLRKAAAPVAAAPVERRSVVVGELPAWLQGEFSGRLRAAEKEQEKRVGALESAVVELREALRTLGRVEFAKGNRMYATANMAKDALVKKAESGLFGVRRERGTPGAKRLLGMCSAAMEGFRAVPPKQIVLVTHYFVKEGGAVVAALRKMEGEMVQLQRFFEGDGRILEVRERVVEVSGAALRKEEQAGLVRTKLADAEREERQALGARAEAEGELGALLQSEEWKAWEAARAEWERRSAKLARTREEWLGVVRPLERAFRKAEHDGKLAAADAQAVRDWLAGARPGNVAEVLERFSRVAEEPEQVQKVAANAAAWLREEREWTEPERPAGPEAKRAELEERARQAAALAERAVAEQRRLATDREKLEGEVRALLTDAEDAVHKGTGRPVTVVLR